MLLIRCIEINNFVCFDKVVIEPSVKKEKPLTIIRAENGSGKTTLLRAIRWGMYGEKGLPGNPSQFSLHLAEWIPDEQGIETRVSILFETDGSSREHLEGNETTTKYELRRSVKTIANKMNQSSGPDFRRINEDAQLLIQQSDGSWLPHEAGVDKVIDELLPWDLRDFFVMDADEAADYVGGSENKDIQRQEVIKKTSSSVQALLGLDIFESSTDRVKKIGEEFGRRATKAVNDKQLDQQQEELDQLRFQEKEISKRINENQREKLDLQEKLDWAREELEKLLQAIGAYDELGTRLKEIQNRCEQANKQRIKTTNDLAKQVTSIALLGSLASREVSRTRQILQPLYEDGSIPIKHLEFVRGILDKGICICGQDISSKKKRRENIQNIITKSSRQEDRANYLAQVLHAANALQKYHDGAIWQNQCIQYETDIAELDEELSKLKTAEGDIQKKLSEVDDQAIQTKRNEIAMLEQQVLTIERDLVGDQEALKQSEKRIRELVGLIQSQQRSKQEARHFKICEERAMLLVRILERAYTTIRGEQISELSSEMNALFGKMAANVVDDDELEGSRNKTAIRMIDKVGLRSLEERGGDFEIFAENSRGRSMPPTEINGASRRILALSFVLALCKVSRTFAPLVADSLLNFMSGSVRTNTLRITAETASQPILLLTGSDLESQNEVDLITSYANATYTLTGQWQHTNYGGDVVNLNDARKISLVCGCGPREFCDKCERKGQAENPDWIKCGQKEGQQ